MGGIGRAHYVLLEMHYDNPQGMEGKEGGGIKLLARSVYLEMFCFQILANQIVRIDTSLQVWWTVLD